MIHYFCLAFNYKFRKNQTQKQCDLDRSETIIIQLIGKDEKGMNIKIKTGKNENDTE